MHIKLGPEVSDIQWLVEPCSCSRGGTISMNILYKASFAELPHRGKAHSELSTNVRPRLKFWQELRYVSFRVICGRTVCLKNDVIPSNTQQSQ